MRISIPSTFHRKDFSASAVTMSTLRMPANQADDEERLRVEVLVPDGEAHGVEQLGHDEQHKAVVQGGENDRFLAVRPLDRPDDVMDDPDSQEPREQHEERRDDEVDAVLDELQEALYPAAALDLRENESHSQHARGAPARGRGVLPNEWTGGWSSGSLPVVTAWGKRPDATAPKPTRRRNESA